MSALIIKFLIKILFWSLKMKKITLSLALCAVVASSMAAKTVVEISYSYPKLFKKVHQELEEKFEALHPDIDVKVRSGSTNYEDETQKVLRQSITKKMPDISFQGLNRFRIFADKNLAVDIGKFVKEDKSDLKKIGFDESLYSAGMFGDKVFGVPFAVSMPIGYYNMDLLKKAGWDTNNLPKTWDDTIELAKKVNALKDNQIKGMYYYWPMTGNWFWEALVFSQGGTMLNKDESKVAFDGEIGLWSMNMLKRFATEADMPFVPKGNVARSDFIAGNIAAFYTSTSDIEAIGNAVGDKFEMKTEIFPNVKEGVGRLPAGGNGAVLLTTDPRTQKAAYEVIKFWCGPEGSKVVAKKTGYMPPNQVAAKELKEAGFYKENPNKETAIKELPYMTGWYAFPGKNTLKITEIIKDHMEEMVGLKVKDPSKVLESMTQAVEKQLPKK